MKPLLNIVRRVALGLLALGVIAVSAPAVHADSPNWKVSSVGTSTLVDLDLVNFTRTVTDAFHGRSSHLGKFTATGSHVLDLSTGQFVGVATYTAANGDTMNVTYTGQLFLSGDADFPYGAIADIEIHGGTGRFTNATGGGVLRGSYTGETPVGHFYFDIDGTLARK